MASTSATVQGWACRASKTWFPSSGWASLDSNPEGVVPSASSPVTSGTTSSGNKYTIMIAVTTPSSSSIGSISSLTVSFKPFDRTTAKGTLYGSLRTVSQSGSTASDTLDTYRASAIGSEASIYGLGTSPTWQSMTFNGSFSKGTTYYLFLYTKSTNDIYGCDYGSDCFGASVEYTVKSYTVSYNANGGSGAPSSQTKYYNTDLKLSTTKPTKANASAGSYTVTLNANGGSCSTTSLSAARTTKYTFSKWNTNSSGTGTSYASGATYTGNAALKLYAIYTGSTTTSSVTLPTPTRDGYDFMGWATSTSASSGNTGSYTPAGNVTLYAIWGAKGLIYIDNGTSIDAYQVYIDNGSSWDLYAPYVDSGSAWSLCS